METTNTPLVSVLMTSYNREKYIAEAIESVLKSTYCNFELIIVDDGSKDKTVEIAKSYQGKDNRIKVHINEKNLGDYPNRNKAASYANGEYLTYVDSDDMLLPNAIEKMVEAVNLSPESGAYMLTRDIDEFYGIQTLSPEESYTMHFEKVGFLETGPLGTLISKKVFNSLGGFSGKRMIGDVEFYLKLASKYPITKIEKNLVFYRVHENQETTEGEKYYLVEIVKVYKEMLFQTNCPVYHKRNKYLFKVIKPRLINSVKLFLKTGDFKKIKYIISLIKIYFEK